MERQGRETRGNAPWVQSGCNSGISACKEARQSQVLFRPCFAKAGQKRSDKYAPLRHALSPGAGSLRLRSIKLHPEGSVQLGKRDVEAFVTSSQATQCSYLVLAIPAS
jgi:hypothetical protein